MGNPLFDMLGGNRPGMGGGPMNMLQQFQQFRQRMQGVNPQEEVKKLLQSGRISQAQLDKAQQMAQQFKGLLK